MDDANSTQSSSAASTKRKGKLCATFGCSNTLYGADGSLTHFHLLHYEGHQTEESMVQLHQTAAWKRWLFRNKDKFIKLNSILLFWV